MGTLLSYSGLSTKIRAMESQLINTEQLQEIVNPGTYSPQHSDLRLLAIPASCSRVADYNPN